MKFSSFILHVGTFFFTLFAFKMGKTQFWPFLSAKELNHTTKISAKSDEFYNFDLKPCVFMN